MGKVRGIAILGPNWAATFSPLITVEGLGFRVSAYGPWDNFLLVAWKAYLQGLGLKGSRGPECWVEASWALLVFGRGPEGSPMVGCWWHRPLTNQRR